MSSKALPAPPAGLTGWPWDTAHVALPPQMPDGQPWPRIMVVTPSYNQGQYLEAAIRSVLLQGYPNLEYMVLDGGSADASVAIIERYAAHLDYWVSERDGGQAAAIAAGFARASGSILTWLNSDDLLLPGALAAVAQHWQATPECAFLAGDGSFVDATAQAQLYAIRTRAYTYADLLGYHRGQYLAQPAVFFSRALYQQVGGLDPRLCYTMDLDLWLRMRRLAPLHHVPLCLALLRQHDDAKTWRDNERALGEAYTVVRSAAQDRGLLVQVALWRDYRLALAMSQLRRGLRLYFAHEGATARAALRAALRSYPPALATRAGLQLTLRLILPAPLRRLVFRAT